MAQRIPKELHEESAFLASKYRVNKYDMSTSHCLEFLLSHHEYLLYHTIILNIFVFIHTVNVRIRKKIENKLFKNKMGLFKIAQHRIYRLL